jgi:isopenicillin-N epimerase
VAEPEPPTPIPGARLLFSLDPGVAHLNHGSFGAVPIPVRRAQQRLRDELDANPMRFFAQGLLERLAHTRRHLATFLGADPDGTALVANATTGVATVLRSLRLGTKDEILLTNHGYGAVALAAEREQHRSGVSVRTVALPLVPTDDEVVASVTAAVIPHRTRLVILDEVTSPTARLMPVARVAAALNPLGVPLLVDGAHAPGMLPVRVTEYGAAFWVGNLHKWAYAPPGTGVLAVAPEWRDRLEALVVSHWDGSGFPAALDWHGTDDYTTWLCAPVGLFVLRSLGLDEVREHNARLAAYGQLVVGRALGLSDGELPGGPGADGVSMRVVPLPPDVATTTEAANALRQRISAELATETAVSAWGGRGLLRLSAQIYNRPEEYDRLAERLPTLLREPA